MTGELGVVFAKIQDTTLFQTISPIVNLCLNDVVDVFVNVVVVVVVVQSKRCFDAKLMKIIGFKEERGMMDRLDSIQKCSSCKVNIVLTII